jgi:hypothetical protein
MTNTRLIRRIAIIGTGALAANAAQLNASQKTRGIHGPPSVRHLENRS